MDIKDFAKIGKDDYEKAYNRLVKATRVIYSGSINPLINKIDVTKIQFANSMN
jgi:hypothetical protein